MEKIVIKRNEKNKKITFFPLKGNLKMIKFFNVMINDIIISF